jgi:hypothetical protein
MSGLSIPERIVYAAEAAMQGAASDVYQSPLGDKVDGFAVDFARVAGAAVIDVLAEALTDKMHGWCASGTPRCLNCRHLWSNVGHLRLLAQQVRDVPALKAV